MPTLELHWSPTARAARAALSHPGVLLGAAGSPDPVEVDGRRLHPALQGLLALGERTGMTDETGDVDQRRAQLRQMARLSSPVVGGVRTEDRTIPGPDGPIPVRTYRPDGAPPTAPGIVYFHGGGWVVGDLDTHDPTCRLLSVVAGAVVVSVDYRLAPEPPFPAAIDDGVAAWAWVADHADELGIDVDRLGVMGDSAGATLSAVVAQQARGGAHPTPAVQCLVYPLADSHLRADSYRTFATGFGLTLESIEWFRARYLPTEADRDDPRASPILADDLTGSAPAIVVTAGFDPLRDDGAAYAAALADAGVAVRHREHGDMIHGFHGMLALPDALTAAVDLAVDVGAALRA